jgi:mono/diheme cytochrome c family protein
LLYPEPTPGGKKVKQLLFAILLSSTAHAAPLIVDDRPLVYRVALQKTPSRGIAVGYPSQFNAVLDSVSFRPLYVWTGGFLNLAKELKGRGGNACSIGGARIDLQLPAMPLRFADPSREPESVQFRGYLRSGRTVPVFLADIDGHRVSLQIISEVRNQVILRYGLRAERATDAYFAIGSLKKSEILPGPGTSWTADGNALRLPPGQSSFHIILDISARKATIMKQEKVTGQTLYAQYCSACHSLSEQKLIGPSFKGLLGKHERIVSAGKPSEIIIDAAYLARSITDPQADIVDGYQAVPMPPFKAILSPAEIQLLIQFISEQK